MSSKKKVKAAAVEPDASLREIILVAGPDDFEEEKTEIFLQVWS